MSEKKHELLLIFAALLICSFFLVYELFDSPKFNSIEAVPISTTEYFIRETSTAASGTVNINTACTEELCSLEGIGKSKAAAIIGYREKNGNFRTPEEIMQVSGISKTIFNKNKSRITV